MRTLLALAIASGAETGAACGDGPGGDLRQPEPRTLATFERDMCACRDATCAKRVVAEMAAWTRRIPADAPKPDPKESAKIMRRYNLCMTEAAGSAIPR